METKKCKICGEEFSGEKKQAYCRVTKTRNCEICGKSFTYICAGATYKITCSKSCCSKLIRRNKGEKTYENVRYVENHLRRKYLRQDGVTNTEMLSASFVEKYFKENVAVDHLSVARQNAETHG